jgi:hypothetical protein
MSAEPTGAPVAGSLWEGWSRPFEHFAAFETARSALAALLRAHGISRAWLPAYVCASLAAGAAAGAAQVAYYETDFSLTPLLATLAAQLQAGDAVVIVDYFGRARPDLWGALIAQRPDILWVEDRAQALDPNAAPLAPSVIYSPRKLVGVGDGGILFARAPVPQPSAPHDASRWGPEEARSNDPNGLRPERWYPLFRAREEGFAPGPGSASPRTLNALQRLSIARIGRARRRNWGRLAKALPEHALWPDREPDFAPLAFPILVRDAAAAVGALAEARIWAPRHWADLPSDPHRFEAAHRLAAHCVSLPCDQRYGEADMARLAKAVLEGVAPYPR